MIVQKIPNINLSLLNQLNPKRYPFLLENNSLTKSRQGFSILFTHPEQSLTLSNINDFDFLTTLTNNITQTKTTNTWNNLPFIGGYIVYLSYELIAQIEAKLTNQVIFSNYPIAQAIRITSAVIVDNKKQQSYIIDRYNNQNKINDILEDIKVINKQKTTAIKAIIKDFGRDKFISTIATIKQYIKNGDVFQVNLSRLWEIQLLEKTSNNQIYQALQKSNPAPFSALVEFDSFTIICSSPERLFQVRNNIIQTQPIAGTYPRSKNKNTLLNHPKERAEHIMLLDLERNDLGRICQYGSIKVDKLMQVKTYKAVHHMVSTITGKLNKNINFSDIIKAIFPGGTITGCPKIRCMEIISELEKTHRGAYTGSLGYISDDGQMDFNILIRSLVRQGEVLTFRAGAGIVYDSDAKKEADETEHKAAAVLKIFTS